MNNQEDQDSFSQQETGEQNTRSKTGDVQSPWPDGESLGNESAAAGNAGQKETGGTGGYGGTSGAPGAGQAEK